jgi:hypothetical protein
VAASVIRRVAPDAPLPTPVRSTGIAPVHHLVAPAELPAAVGAATTGLLGQVEGTVGVITSDRDRVAGWLASLTDPRLQVVTSLEAKGMEYDAVVLVEPAEIAAAGPPAGLRTLYVALSRATQRLTTVATVPWRD